MREAAAAMLARKLPEPTKAKIRRVIAIRDRRTAKAFHRLFYGSRTQTWKNTRWLGVPLKKNPLDLWVYQELVAELQPELIVETGTAFGGSALYLASLCDLVGRGQVVTVDLQEPENPPQHERVRYLTGSSTAPEIVSEVAALSREKAPVMVILDSDHRKEHVLDELRLYSPLVTPGSYLIVEDSNVNGNPVFPSYGPGPAEAIAEFLREQSDFAADASREKYFVTFNPGGFLRRRPGSRVEESA